jgi:hypothetical protein
MKAKVIVTMLFLALVFPAMGCAHGGRGSLIDVRIVSDGTGDLAQYRTYPPNCPEGRYFYMEAVKGERYSIAVANRSDRKVGVVIAVDGRNIISGMKSDLKPTERMYIIAPYTTQTFEGWRTDMDRTNRFYFTEQSDSYAERAFSDGSAMGTIALAVYRERFHEKLSRYDEAPAMRRPQSAPAPSASKDAGAALEGNASDRKEKKSEQAGTGFGETTYSPARMVRFEAEMRVAEKIVVKYEWRSELCRKGIITCEPKNRLWPGGGFAPVPRDFRG